MRIFLGIFTFLIALSVWAMSINLSPNFIASGFVEGVFILKPAADVDPQKDCAQLLNELNKAQADWQSAADDWTKKSNQLSNAERRMNDISNNLLGKTEADIIHAESDLEKANAGSPDCAKSANDPNSPLSPLVDCSAVENARKKLDNLNEEKNRLQQELDDLEKQTEKLENETEAAHQTERSAAKALEAAEQAYANKCGGFWAGTIRSYSSIESTKETTDKGAARAMVRNTNRINTQTMLIQSTITVALLAPEKSSAGKVMARVQSRIENKFTKTSDTSGEMLCRLPKRNPFWKGFNDKYSETLTQSGDASETLPVSISFNDDGSYKIRVATPGVQISGSSETDRMATDCGDKNLPPKKDVLVLGSEKTPAGTLDIDRKIPSKNRDVLSGTQNDGKTTISWNLRFVRPKKN